VIVHAATLERWGDLVSLFERPGPRGGMPIPSHCWCQFWHLRGRTYHESRGEANRARLERQIDAGPPPGLIAYLDGEAVGWCRLGPRESFERIEHSRTLVEPADGAVTSIVCFYVHPATKRRGVASALLEAAIPHARAAGAAVLEAYAARPEHPNIDSYTGYLPMFLRAGFEPVRAAGRRTIVRLDLRG
jgi:GNAT superfamily N-acetyltransferase